MVLKQLNEALPNNAGSSENSNTKLVHRDLLPRKDTEKSLSCFRSSVSSVVNPPAISTRPPIAVRLQLIFLRRRRMKSASSLCFHHRRQPRESRPRPVRDLLRRHASRLHTCLHPPSCRKHLRAPHSAGPNHFAKGQADVRAALKRSCDIPHAPRRPRQSRQPTPPSEKYPMRM